MFPFADNTYPKVSGCEARISVQVPGGDEACLGDPSIHAPSLAAPPSSTTAAAQHTKDPTAGHRQDKATAPLTAAGVLSS